MVSHMENQTNGNADAPTGLVTADAGSPSTYLDSFSRSEQFRLARTSLERAEDILAYGRRQEAEAALEQIREAVSILAHIEARLDGEG